MALVKIKIIILVIFLQGSLFRNPLFAAGKELPVLTSKQDIKNIRYMSEDGRNTYYQRRSGGFYLSSKFKLHEIIKGKQGTEYSAYTSHHQKMLLVIANRTYHNLLSIRKPLDIFVTAIGSLSAKFVDSGVKPRLHLDDTWVSYYNHKEKVLHFRNIKNDINDFEINVGNALNPYFIPEVVMLNENEIVYSALNNNGFPGIIHFNRTSKEFVSIYKSNSINQRFEFCRNDKNLFITELTLNNDNQGTKIHKVMLPMIEKSLNAKSVIYKSKLNDFGKVICAGIKDSLYFIKNLTTDTGKEFYEVAQLNLTNNTVEVVTNLRYVTDLMYHGGRIIIPMHGKNYVLVGEHEPADDRININDAYQEPPEDKSLKKKPIKPAAKKATKKDDKKNTDKKK